MKLLMLSHYDDELFFLENLISINDQVTVLYTTNSLHPKSVSLEKRRRECVLAWSKINENAKVLFIGLDEHIPDGKLSSSFSRFHLEKVIKIVEEFAVEEIWALSPEGGHQDHDFTYFLARYISSRLEVNMRHKPAYSQKSGRSFLSFEVMSESFECTCEPKRLKLRARLELLLKLISLFYVYRSQWRTWLGLGPFVIVKNLRGQTILHSCQQNTPRPVNRSLWVKRRRADYEDFISSLELLRVG